MSVVAQSFITLEDARRHLRIPIDDRAHDHRLEECVNAAAHLMTSITGRILIQTTHTNQYLTGDGTVLLSLPEYPIVPSHSITVRVSAIRAWDSESDLAFWNGNSGEDAENAAVIVADEGAAILERVDGDVWPRQSRSIRITYQAGYATTDDRYYQMAEAQQLLTNWYWSNEGLNQTLQSLNLPGATMSYVQAGMPVRALAILKQHSRNGVSLC